MAKKGPYLQTSFSQGEVSEFINARPDVAKRYNSVATCENFWLLPEGGATRRPGSMFGGEVEDSAVFTRAIPFEYSTEDAFILLFGDQTIRFVKNRAAIMSGLNPYQIVSPYLEADLRDLHHEQSNDFLFITSLREDLDIKKLARVADDDWTMSDFNANPPPSFEADESLGVDGAPSANTGSVKWRSNGDVFLAADVGRQIVAGAGRAVITALDTARQVSIDILDAFSATIAAGPNTLTSSGTTVTSTAHALIAGNYIVLTAGAQSGEIRRVASITDPDEFEIDNAFGADQAAPVAWNKVTAFAAGAWLLRLSPQTTLDVNKKEPVGAQVDLQFGAGALRASYVGKFLKLYGGLIKITARDSGTSTTDGTGIILSILNDAESNPAAAPAGSWRLQESSWSSTRGRPRTLRVHGGRLVLAASPTQPTTLWGSSIDDIFNFAVGSLADNAYEYLLQGGQRNPIQWMVSHVALYLGDSKQEYSAKGKGTDNPISGDETPNVVPINFAGSKHVQPVVVDNAIVFLQRFGHDLIILSYSLQQSPDATSLVGSEPNLFSRHIGDMVFALHPPAYAAKPYSIIFQPLENGQLAGLTFKPMQEVVAFSRTVTRAGDEIESVAVVPHEDGKRLTVYQIVKRTINGATKRYWEWYEDDAEDLQDRVTDGVKWAGLQTDCAKTGEILEGETEISGLEHLATETVDVIIGDSYIGQKAVSAGGVVTLTDDEAPTGDTIYEVGLHFDSTLKTLRPTIPGEVTDLFKRHWPVVGVRVKDSIGGKINGKVLKKKAGGSRMYNGLLVMENLETSDPLDGALTILQDQPYPLTVLNVAGEISFGDGAS